MAVVLRPTTELVVAAWLGQIDDLSAQMIGSTLPKDQAAWSENGFVQAVAVGGSPRIHIPVRRPVVQIDCWAVNANSQKAPWAKANYLAEVIRFAADESLNMGRALTLTSPYPAARVLSAYLLTEPRRIVGDEANYARYQFDLQLHWVVA